MFKIAKYLFLLACSISCFFFSPCTAFSASLSLAWDSSPSPDVTGYRLYYGKKPGAYGPWPIETGNVTEYTVTGLQKNQVYYFAITAVSADGIESGFSSEVSTLHEFVGTARLFSREHLPGGCELEQEAPDSIEVSLAVNYLRPGSFMLESEAWRLSCRERDYDSDESETREAFCLQKNSLGVRGIVRMTLSSTGDIRGYSPLGMTAEIYSIVNRACPLYVIEMQDMVPVL